MGTTCSDTARRVVAPTTTTTTTTTTATTFTTTTTATAAAAAAAAATTTTTTTTTTKQSTLVLARQSQTAQRAPAPRNSCLAKTIMSRMSERRTSGRNSIQQISAGQEKKGNGFKEPLHIRALFFLCSACF